MSKDEALDKKAENARELGLDYEPVLKDNSNYRLDPPVAEPVVFYRCNGCGHAYEQVHPTSCDCMEAGGFDRVEYYTAPPAQPAPVQGLPFGVGGGLVAIKTLLSRDPCVHANTAIEMIDAILKEHPAAQPAPVQPVADAWMHEDGRLTDAKAKTARAENFHGWRPLAFITSATPPAAQRQWVGLTDEEMYLNCPNWLSQEQCKVWIQQIEAKLKEKNAAAQPAVPDAIHHTDLSESLEYIQGWNDCRQAMLEMMK
jgi:hypothetical protein